MCVDNLCFSISGSKNDVLIQSGIVDANDSAIRCIDSAEQSVSNNLLTEIPLGLCTCSGSPLGIARIDGKILVTVVHMSAPEDVFSESGRRTV